MKSFIYIIRIRSSLFFFLIFLFFYSCNPKPRISVSNTLEIALDNHNKYSEYVRILNKAFEKDSTALLNFFKVDYIYDAAGYDHGYVLFQLMKIYGDKTFSQILRKATGKDLDNVRQYFEVGIDANDRERDEMKISYPISSKILHRVLNLDPMMRILQHLIYLKSRVAV